MMFKNKNNQLEQGLQDMKTRTANEIKNYIYDIIALVIIVAIVMASLDVLGFVDLFDKNARQELFSFIVSWVPFFMAAILLNSVRYEKGVHVGKQTANYKSIIKNYSDIINSLTGEQIANLDEFCDEYNDQALKSIQEQILKKEGLSYDRFISDYIVDDVTYKSYISCTDEELIANGLNENRVKAVRKAKEVKIKGISSNKLLSSINVDDKTDIGPDEKTLARKESISSTIKTLVSTICMGLMVIKDITSWKWVGLIIVIFKVAYIVAKSYTNYFKGYNNLTIDVANHISRKTDILKMYLKWKPTVEVVEIKEVSSVETND